MSAKAVIAMLLVLTLAGCSSPKETQAVPPGELEDDDLKSGKGGIKGIAVDDAYRPISEAPIFLLPLGLETTTTLDGEFAFVDLDPDNYEILAQAPGHEASQIPVQVIEGEFSDATVEARRIVNEGSRIVVTEYSVFIPCAADFVVNFIVADCTADASQETFRSGFQTDLQVYNGNQSDNVTFVITEMMADNVGDYNVQMRAPNNGQRYAVVDIYEDQYVKIVVEWNNTNTEHNMQNNNGPWMNDRPFDTILFVIGKFKEEVKEVGENNPGSPIWVGNLLCCGVGANFGVRATFYQSVFLGPPEVDIASYTLF